jgi:hypothetical protein
MDMRDSKPRRRRKIRGVHVAIIVVLLLFLGVFAVEGSRIGASLLGHGPPTVENRPTTTPERAQARSQGADPMGSNTSQDSYTAQNQSRPPPADR